MADRAHVIGFLDEKQMIVMEIIIKNLVKDINNGGKVKEIEKYNNMIVIKMEP